MEYDIHSMLKHRQKIGSGIDRVAFFCPEYEVVIKRSINFELRQESIQSSKEKELFGLLTEDEKKCFGFIAFVEYKGIIHIIMKRVTIIDKMFRGHYSSCELFDENQIVTLCAARGYDDIHYDEFFATMKKYNIYDLHGANIGLDETGRLVIIDAGFVFDY